MPLSSPLLRLAVVCGDACVGWRSARRASALGTSFSAAIEPSGSLFIGAYNRIVALALLHRVARRLARGARTDRDRLLALVRWAHENVVPQYAGPDRVVPDDLLGVLRRGYGHCDQSAHVFAALARLAGYDARLLFLRAPDGTSPHTVAEARAGGAWILVDPWIGTLFADEGGRLLGVPDLRSRPALLSRYERRLAVDASHFERGTRFRAFPYQSLRAFPAKAAARRARRPAAAVRGRPLAPPPPERGEARPEDRRPGDAEVVRLDLARWAHLDGRYSEAVTEYRALLGLALPKDMRQAVGFFLGLALLRAGSATEAILALDAALDADPDTPWAPSIRFHRAEAKLGSGDVVGAVEDLRAADIPSASEALASVGRGSGRHRSRPAPP